MNQFVIRMAKHGDMNLMLLKVGSSHSVKQNRYILNERARMDVRGFCLQTDYSNTKILDCVKNLKFRKLIILVFVQFLVMF